MGVTIFSSGETSSPTFIRLASCEVCMLMNDFKYANDIERIFAVLNTMQAKHLDLSKTDELMCPVHAKKIQGLKIFTSQDELFELDNTSSKKQNPQVTAISEEEYNKAPEIMVAYLAGESDGENGMQDVSQLLF